MLIHGTTVITELKEKQYITIFIFLIRLTVNDRLNALGVYFKCTNLENKNILLVGHVPIELLRLKYVARSESGKMARVLYDKLQEIKEKYMFNDVLRKTKRKIVNF